MTITADLLATPLERLLGTPARLRGWKVTPLSTPDPGIPGMAAVWRVTGQSVTADGRVHAWSLIVKDLRSPAGFVLPDGRTLTPAMAEDATAFGYWRREALLAQSGLRKTLPDGLATARTLGVTDLSERLLLWQEDLAADAAWTWSDYRRAAYRLGLWQGAFVTGERPLPREPWLVQNWLRGFCRLPLPGIVDMLERAGAWTHPALTAHFLPYELAQLRRIWLEREVSLAALDALPQTWCHLDAHRGNLFRRGDDLILIDWSFSGRAALGEELVAFVGGTLLLDHVALDDAVRLESVAFDGYTAGLRAAGWRGSTAVVERAYRAALPLRYALLSLASMLRAAMDPDHGRYWAEHAGRPLPDLLHHRANFIRFLLSISHRLPAAVAAGADSGCQSRAERSAASAPRQSRIPR